MGYRKKFLTNSFLYLLAMIMPKVANFIILPIYTRYIDPASFGIFSITTSVIGVMSVLSSMGLNAFYLRNYTSAKDQKELNGTIFWSMCIWNIVLFLISIIILPLSFNLLKVSVPFFPYMFLALLTQLFNSMEIIPMRTYRIKGEVKYYFIRILFKTIISVSLGLMLVVKMNLGIHGRYYAELFNSSIFSIVFIIYMYRNSHFRIKKELLFESLKFSLPIVPSDLLQMSTPVIINIIIQRMLSLAQLGVYSIGLTIASLVQLVTTSIGLTVEPEVYKRMNSIDFPIFFARIKNFTIVIVSIVCVGAGLFVRDATMLLLDERFWDSWRVVQIISVSYIISALKGKFSQLSIIQGRTKLLLFSNLSYLLVSAFSSYITLSIWSEIALGWANLFGMIASFLVLYFYVDKSEHKELKLLRDFFSIGVSLGVLYLSRFFHDKKMIESVASNMIIYISYIIFIMYFYKISLFKMLDKIANKKL